MLRDVDHALNARLAVEPYKSINYINSDMSYVIVSEYNGGRNTKCFDCAYTIELAHRRHEE
jgi:hypothetical protein